MMERSIPDLERVCGEPGSMMRIRPAAPNDVDHIAALYVKNHRETYQGILSEEYFSRLTPAYAKDKWLRFLTEPGMKLWAAFEEDAFLGFSAGMRDPALPDTWYLDSLHVVSDARGKGIGTALIHTNGAYAAEHGYAGMSICIVRGNRTARNLYTKLGAVHFTYFDDDFCGTVSHSEKLLWKDLSEFKAVSDCR